MSDDRRLFIAITGASGVVYAKRLLEAVAGLYDTIYITASENSMPILEDELGITELPDILPEGRESKFVFLGPHEIDAPPASGSHRYDGMVIVPCSMGTTGRIAAGVSDDLITRAADVCLKERRKLILVVRETPYSLIHLENLTTLTRAGATILPASPAFYHKPEKIGDLVDFVVDRILQHLEINIALINHWLEDQKKIELREQIEEGSREMWDVMLETEKEWHPLEEEIEHKLEEEL